MADYTISAKITGDASGYQKAFSEAQKAADNTAKKWKAFQRPLPSLLILHKKLLEKVYNKLQRKVVRP